MVRCGHRCRVLAIRPAAGEMMGNMDFQYVALQQVHVVKLRLTARPLAGKDLVLGGGFWGRRSGATVTV